VLLQKIKQPTKFSAAKYAEIVLCLVVAYFSMHTI